MRFGAGIDREWPFLVDNKQQIITVTGNRTANDGSLVRQWCLQGHGIAYKSYWDVKDDLAEGRLMALLPDYSTHGNAVQAVYQGGRSIPKRVRALIDALILAFSQ